jgi:hypothetical protein
VSIASRFRPVGNRSLQNFCVNAWISCVCGKIVCQERRLRTPATSSGLRISGLRPRPNSFIPSTKPEMKGRPARSAGSVGFSDLKAR